MQRHLAMMLLLCWWLLLSGAVQQPNAIERVVLAGNARVERVDISTRSVTLRAETGATLAVYVDPQLKVFDQLRSGDQVRVRVLESVIVAMTHDRPTIIADTTAAARKAGDGSTEVMQQLKGVVTIDSVDHVNQTVVYHSADNRSVTRFAVDPRLLEGLKKGDVVEITYTRQRAVELEKR